MNNPLVSIIIPSFNSQEFIAETLDSVMSQIYGNWECIIVDDGSEDGTIGIIQEYCKRDKRFRFYSRHREPKGASVCRNIGLDYSMGEFVVFLDSDDLLDMNCLDGRIKSLLNNPEYDLWIFPTGHFMKKPGDSPFRWNILHKEMNDLERFILHDNPWCITGPIWCRHSLSVLNGLDEKAVCWQDWELHIRMIMNGLSYYKENDNQIDAYYRKARSSDSTSISSDKNSSAFIHFKIDLYKAIYESAKARGLPVTLKTAFKIAFYKMIVEVNHRVNRYEAIKLTRYCFQNEIIDGFEKLLYTLENYGNSRCLLINSIQRISKILLVRYDKEAYRLLYSSSYIYNMTANIDDLFSTVYMDSIK